MSETTEGTTRYPHNAEEAMAQRDTRGDNRGGGAAGRDDNQNYEPLEKGKAYTRDQLGDDLTAYIKTHRGGSRGATNLPSTVGFALDWATENADVLAELPDDERAEAKRSRLSEGHRNGRAQEEERRSDNHDQREERQERRQA
jgi:hypothetical protein